MDFKLTSDYEPTGDQPKAIAQLVEGIKAGEQHQTLLGVTGSGKTFTIANLINQVNRPTLILSHNKTLAAQLYGEFKHFFPENAVEYFISYYDYYQPEAYVARTGLTPFMGETGAFDGGSSLDQRIAYHAAVREAFAPTGIGMCACRYANTFPFWDADPGQWLPRLAAAFGLSER